MIDVLLLGVLAAVTWCVSSDGPWGAAITFVSVLLAGLLAMNVFEPLAAFCAANFMNSFAWQNYWDIIALLGVFSVAVTLFRVAGEKLLPTYAEVHSLLYEFARWGFGLGTGYVVMAILLTALHTAPLPREFIGFAPERQNFFQISAPDRQWLGFTQYVSETSLVRAYPVIFDGAVYPRIPGNAQTNQVWASFPIRYADRRGLFAGGGGGIAPASTSAPPPSSSSNTPPAGNSGGPAAF